MPHASLERLTRAKQFRRQGDVLRCLGAEALLRHALAEVFGMTDEAMFMESGRWGKPRLAGNPGIHFNLSHSGPWVLCAVHNMPVGIDVEEVRSWERLPVEALMSPEELGRFVTLPPLKARDFFFRLWTLKESLLKAMGLGFGLDPRSIHLDLDGAGVTVFSTAGGQAYWRPLELGMPEGAKAAVSFRC